MQDRKKILLSIIGPTGAGKSDLALFVAQQILADPILATSKFSGVDIISADSKQVYQGLEVLTGADIPQDFTCHQMPDLDNLPNKYYANADSTIRIFGIAMIQPSDEWSVAHFQKYARKIISLSWSQQRLPILVGGTGLYHDKLWEDDDSLRLAPSPELRQNLEKLSVEQLRSKLQTVDLSKFEQMNHSDQNNPRRLIRAIEIASAKNQYNHKNSKSLDKLLKPDHQLTIGLTLPLDQIQEKITARVNQRWQGGVLDEIEKLKKLNLSPTLPVWQTIGAKEVASFWDDEIEADDCRKLWALHEYQYAKRQLTWWRHKVDIVWLDRTDDGFSQKAWENVKLHLLYT